MVIGNASHFGLETSVTSVPQKAGQTGDSRLDSGTARPEEYALLCKGLGHSVQVAVPWLMKERLSICHISAARFGENTHDCKVL